MGAVMHFVEIIIEYLTIFMFLTMGVLLFIGYPVGFILGGVAITYGFIGYMFGVLGLQNSLILYLECGVFLQKT